MNFIGLGEILDRLQIVIEIRHQQIKIIHTNTGKMDLPAIFKSVVKSLSSIRTVYQKYCAADCKMAQMIAGRIALNESKYKISQWSTPKLLINIKPT